MKNFISIQNNGLICPEDIILIGSSTKRGDDSKIGQFGSGWKFALAWVLRNELEIKIFAGTEEIVVDFAIKMHRNEPVKVLTVNGQETSITSGMGEIDWRGWMALREIVSNAIDEGGEEVRSVYNPVFAGVEDKTTIFIQMNGELADILRCYEDYFSFDRVAYYSNEKMRLFKKPENSKTIVFRKGIRCYEYSKKTLFDVSFTDITINESRLSTESYMDQAFREAIPLIDKPEVLLELIEGFDSDILPRDLEGDTLALMTTLCATKKFMPISGTSFSAALPGRIAIPNTWYTKLRDLGLCEDVFEVVYGKAKSEVGEFFVLEETEDVLAGERLTYAMKEFVNLFDAIIVVTHVDQYASQSIIGKICYLDKKYMGTNANNDTSTLASILSRMNQHTYAELIKCNQSAA